MTIEPSKSVPKKYWKYASKFPTRQLHKVKRVKLGVIVTCNECKRDIPSMEEFIELLFREPNTKWTRKAGMALCRKCAP